MKLIHVCFLLFIDLLSTLSSLYAMEGAFSDLNMSHKVDSTELKVVQELVHAKSYEGMSEIIKKYWQDIQHPSPQGIALNFYLENLLYEELELLFNDLNKNKTQKTQSLRKALKLIAAEQYAKNLGKNDYLVRYEYCEHSKFDPAVYPEEKVKYLLDGAFPAYKIINEDLIQYGYTESALESLIKEEIFEVVQDTLLDTTHSPQTFVNYFVASTYLRNLTFDQLQYLYDHGDKATVLSLGLCLASVVSHKRNLYGSSDWVVILKEIKRFIKKNVSYSNHNYHGIHIFSAPQPWLSWWLLALLQPHFDCPLVVFNPKNSEHVRFHTVAQDIKNYGIENVEYAGFYEENPLVEQKDIFLEVRSYPIAKKFKSYLRRRIIFHSGENCLSPIYVGWVF